MVQDTTEEIFTEHGQHFLFTCSHTFAVGCIV